MTETVTC